MSAECMYDKVVKYRIFAKLDTPMHVGNGGSQSVKNDILIHPANNMPYVQGASILGAMREYYEHVFNEEVNEVFGTIDNDSSKTRIKIHDGQFQSIKRETRPRVRLNNYTGTVGSSLIKGTDKESGGKFEIDYISAGTKLFFDVYLFELQSQNKDYEKHLEECIKALDDGNILIGGQKSNGCGNVKIDKLYKKTFDMKNKENREDWKNDDNLALDAYKEVDITEIKSKSNIQYSIVIKGKTDGNILIKDIFVREAGDNAPDSVNIRNANGDYIIPAASFKGAIRNRMDAVSKFLNKEFAMEEIFGTDNSDEQKIAGNIRFFDTIIGNKKDNDNAPIENHIRIDKFTGGTIYGSLFNEKCASGDVEFRIEILSRNNPDKTLGLLIFAIRDMMLGVFNLGSRYSIGKGFFNVESVIIRSKDKQSEILSIDNEFIVNDDSGLINKAMRSIGGNH